jgi:hypothetical protein
MNFYFVFEGKTEPIVYQSWFKQLFRNLITEVNDYQDVENNNYYYVSDMGVPDCYNAVANAIQDINEVPKYDYLVLFIDADRYSAEERIAEAHQRIFERLNDCKKAYLYKDLPSNCHLEIIVQHVCIETWFLGNRKFFVRNPQTELLKKYIDYFDVSMNNPEDLAHEFIQSEDGTREIFGYRTKALFHEAYFRAIFKERMKGVAYHKSKPREVPGEPYFNQLLKRIQANPKHLASFQNMLLFFRQVPNK